MPNPSTVPLTMANAVVGATVQMQLQGNVTLQWSISGIATPAIGPGVVFLIDPQNTVMDVPSNSEFFANLQIVSSGLPAATGTSTLTFTLSGSTYSCPAASGITPSQLYAVAKQVLSDLKGPTGN